MKKIFLFAALALAATGSWAFYPKATEPGGYMMVVGSNYPDNVIITIGPSGETTTQIIDPKTYGKATKLAAANIELHKAEVRKINELKLAGWKVTSMSAHPNSYVAFFEEVYLLEK